MADCAQCKTPLESEFGFVVCPKCGHTNVLGVEWAQPTNEKMASFDSVAPASSSKSFDSLSGGDKAFEAMNLNFSLEEVGNENELTKNMGSSGVVPLDVSPTSSVSADLNLAQSASWGGEQKLKEETSLGTVIASQDVSPMEGLTGFPLDSAVTAQESFQMSSSPGSPMDSPGESQTLVDLSAAASSFFTGDEAALQPKESLGLEGAQSLIHSSPALQFRLDFFDLDVRALEVRVFKIVESLQLEEFWQTHPKQLGRFTVAPLTAYQLCWLLLRLEGVHDKWKVTALE